MFLIDMRCHATSSLGQRNRQRLLYDIDDYRRW